MQKDQCKNIWPFSCNVFLTRYGRGPATPLQAFRWLTMLDYIFKIILDHSLLDAKGIMEKYSSVFL